MPTPPVRAREEAHPCGRVPLLLPTLAALRALGRARRVHSHRYRLDLETLFPELTRRVLDRAARELEANRFTRVAMRRIATLRGWSFLPGLVTMTGSDALLEARARGPALVLAWHAGCAATVLASLHRLGQEGIVVRRRQDEPLLGFSTVVSGAGIRDRTTALWALLGQLRAGTLAMLFLDAKPPARAAIERSPVMFGRRVDLPRGPAALHRLTGAQIVCAEARWTGARQTPFHVHFEPLSPAADTASDAALTQHLGTHFEAIVRAAPGELWPVSLRLLAMTPRRGEHPIRSDA